MAWKYEQSSVFWRDLLQKKAGGEAFLPLLLLLPVKIVLTLFYDFSGCEHFCGLIQKNQGGFYWSQEPKKSMVRRIEIFWVFAMARRWRRFRSFLASYHSLVLLNYFFCCIVNSKKTKINQKSIAIRMFCTRFIRIYFLKHFFCSSITLVIDAFMMYQVRWVLGFWLLQYVI